MSPVYLDICLMKEKMLNFNLSNGIDANIKIKNMLKSFKRIPLK
jgi:hypothetical protein